MMKFLYYILIFKFSVIFSQDIIPNVTMEKKKLVVLTSDSQNWPDLNKRITHIATNVAANLKRYEIIGRNSIKTILEEQKLQHSGIISPEDAVEIGKLAGANEAVLIQLNIFGQKGIPKITKQDSKEEKSTEGGLFGWIVKEVVKSEINKNNQGIELYPNNIQTIIDGEVSLLNIETGQTLTSFPFNAEYTGGVKSKSLSKTLEIMRAQMKNKFKSFYELSSEILDVDGNNVTLVLGKEMGINSGNLFEIFTRDKERNIRNRIITLPGKSVGIVEIKNVSDDASEGEIIRKWGKVKPGFQAREIRGGINNGSMSFLYGHNPKNLRLRFSGNFNSYGRFGGSLFGDIGTVTDSRGRDDLHLGLGFSINCKLIKSPVINYILLINVPFDFHFRRDDVNIDGESHLVILPIMSPRIGMQTEILLNRKVDLVLCLENILSNTRLGNWTYSEEQENEEKSKSFDAHWTTDEPKINYNGWVLTLGFRGSFFD